MIMDSKINAEMLKITERKNNFQKESVNYKIIIGVFNESFNSTDDFPVEEKRKYKQATSHLKIIKLLELHNKHIMLTDKGSLECIVPETECVVSFFVDNC